MGFVLPVTVPFYGGQMVITYVCVREGGVVSEEGSIQSMLARATPYTTTVHKHGRYRVIAGDVFIRHGYGYPINTTDQSGVRLDILTPIAEQLDAILSIYSRVYFSRFDLRLPEITPIDTGNRWLSVLFKKLRERLKSKLNRP
ncbi:hypothetical protein D3H39_02795, partial [Citrobacter portucalensis]